MEANKKQIDLLAPYKKYLLAIIAVCSLLIYSNTFNHGYVLDDHSVILQHSHVQNGFSGLKSIFTSNYRNGQNGFNDGLYRPLSLATFAIEEELFEGNPKISHVLNSMLYAIACCLLFLSFKQVFDQYPLIIPLGIALLFMAHPLHTEVVANIKGRDELLAFLGLTACLYFISKYLVKAYMTHLLLGIFFFILALFSKESAVTYLLIIPLILWMNIAYPFKKVIKVFLILLPFTLGFLLLREYIISGMPNSIDPGNFGLLNNPIAATEDSSLRWGSTFALQGKMLQKLLFPFPLIHDYSYNQLPLAALNHISSILGILLLISLAIVAIWGILKRRILAIIAAIYLLSVAIPSQIIQTIGVQFAERLLFLAVLPLALLVILGFFYLQKRTNPKLNQKRLIGLVVVLVIFFGFQSFERNKAWANNLTLYQTDIEHASNSARANYNLGTELSEQAKITSKQLLRKEMLQNSANHLRKAIQIYPQYLDAYNNLGIVYKLMGDYPKAIQVYLANIKNDSEYSKNYYNLATAYYDNNEFRKAINSMQEYVSRNPTNADAYLIMGKAAGNLKDFELAVNYLNKALQIAPQRIDILNFHGMANGMIGRQDQAEISFKKALQLEPNRADLLMNLALCFHQQEKFEEEIQTLQKILRIDPNNQTAKNQLQQLSK